MAVSSRDLWNNFIPQSAKLGVLGCLFRSSSYFSALRDHNSSTTEQWRMVVLVLSAQSHQMPANFKQEYHKCFPLRFAIKLKSKVDT